jgi:hypothetical protein
LGSIYNNFYDKNKLEIETIVIDNNSSDNTAAVIENFIKIFPYKIKFIRNNENLGFTKGCNQGIEKSTGDYIMLLNPDTQILEDAINTLYSFLVKNEKTGAVAPQLLTRSKKVQYSCRRFPGYRDLFFQFTLLSSLFPKSRIFSRWKMKYFDHNETREVEQPMAAALLMRKTLFEKKLLLDDSFYMFFNDIDICKQIYEMGYNIFYLPEAKIYHKIGTSILKDRVRMIRVWNRDCLRYFKKHDYNFFLFTLLRIGLFLSGELRILFTKILYK